MLRVCDEKSEQNLADHRWREPCESEVLGLGPFTVILAFFPPEMAATLASQSLPCSQAVDVWETRQHGALVSLVKL